jgi:hypothetical protein
MVKTVVVSKATGPTILGIAKAAVSLRLALSLYLAVFTITTQFPRIYGLTAALQPDWNITPSVRAGAQRPGVQRQHRALRSHRPTH